MGWRSWNCYHQAISQEKMTAAANAMVNKSRGLSLLEVGYENCGLDDYYQACKTGVQGSFHNASGYPLIDKTKFPDMKAMTDHAHSIGLKMGWCKWKPHWSQR
jgi:alpha-galactosidase